MSTRYLPFLLLFLAPLGFSQLSAQAVSANYFRGDTLVELSQSGSAASVTTFSYDAPCEQLQITVTDPDSAVLRASSPYVVRVRDEDGEDIKDLTDRLTVTMRVRSAGAFPVGILFRSGEGTSDFRTSALSFDVPAGLNEWTEASVTFSSADFGSSFDPSDIRDLWFYLDRGNNNFAGNEFYVDHIVIGGAADAAQNSPCELDGGGGSMTNPMLSANYFQGDTLTEFNAMNGAGLVSTFTLDTTCEQLKIEVADPVNAPLGATEPYSVRLLDADGNDVTSLPDSISVTMRVRSAAALSVDVLLRSGNGGPSGRTTISSFDVPASLEEWTEVTVNFGSSSFRSNFNLDDIRDLWFYLDRDNDNFPGNEFYVDHIVVGGMADAEQNSPCSLAEVVAGTFVEYFQTDSLTSFSTDNRAGSSATFDLDTECEILNLSITDPVGAPLPPFNAFQVNPTNAGGERLTSVDGPLSVTMRVRSAEMVNVSILLRSGEGTPDERSELLETDIPAGLEDWTEITVTFTEADLAGFDSASFKDVWFYLDRGTENFPGNFFSIDHITAGTAPDAAQNTPCTFRVEPTEFVVQFDTLTDQTILGGTESDRLSINFVPDCEEVSISVIDPANAPFGAFRPLVINPVNTDGSQITNVAGFTTVYVRARSAEAVPISILFRSGDGSADFRSAILTDTVQGDLTGWSNLEFNFSATDLANFDATDLVDVWIYLDRENDNFPGNELIIDYIAIGSKPDAADASPCGLPDLTVSTNEADWAVGMQLYPNPTSGVVTVRAPALAGQSDRMTARVLDVNGRHVPAVLSDLSYGELRLDLSAAPQGVYFLQLVDASGAGVMRRIVKR
ncbi:T9SS type A sorting domain-containing protein [Neolewinella antarctica]|uniref:Secretion system C-terminal sorting domain-containing protein n=1 Tax=Neolewinella antarctica TaxID=442734 RepID=A0ABX0XEM0_9BACT|nr:T9SS type A sorting domain-containing protein [Neolewinella antarctica]NJC27652.1 hypothetical protein [Neolewinella antarctica]